MVLCNFILEKKSWGGKIEWYMYKKLYLMFYFFFLEIKRKENGRNFELFLNFDSFFKYLIYKFFKLKIFCIVSGYEI